VLRRRLPDGNWVDKPVRVSADRSPDVILANRGVRTKFHLYGRPSACYALQRQSGEVLRPGAPISGSRLVVGEVLDIVEAPLDPGLPPLAPGKLRIRLRCTSGAVKTVDVPEGMPCENLWPRLAHSTGHEPARYEIVPKRLGRPLAPGETLASIGLVSGEVVVLQRSGVAGRAPSDAAEITLSSADLGPPLRRPPAVQRRKGWQALSTWQRLIVGVAGICLALFILWLAMQQTPNHTATWTPTWGQESPAK